MKTELSKMLISTLNLTEFFRMNRIQKATELSRHTIGQGDYFLSGIPSQKEKEHLFSVRGFGMETSNFALNGCLRVSIVRFFDARSNHGLRISLRTL